MAAHVVTGQEELVIATAGALVHRTSLTEVSEQGRYARGVWVMRLDDDDRVTSVAALAPSSRNDPARVAGMDSLRAGAQQAALDLPAANGASANGAGYPPAEKNDNGAEPGAESGETEGEE